MFVSNHSASFAPLYTFSIIQKLNYLLNVALKWFQLTFKMKCQSASHITYESALDTLYALFPLNDEENNIIHGRCRIGKLSRCALHTYLLITLRFKIRIFINSTQFSNDCISFRFIQRMHVCRRSMSGCCSRNYQCNT